MMIDYKPIRDRFKGRCAITYTYPTLCPKVPPLCRKIAVGLKKGKGYHRGTPKEKRRREGIESLPHLSLPVRRCYMGSLGVVPCSISCM